MTKKTAKNSQYWITKTVAGVILGLVIALAISRLFMAMPSSIAPLFKVQIAMWMVAPIWLSIIGFGYLFKTAKSAWLYLMTASVLLVLLNCLLNYI